MSKIKITALGQKEIIGLYIGRPSKLSNPYPTKLSKFKVNKIYDLKTSINKYRKYLLTEISKDKSEIKTQIKILKKRILDDKDIQMNCWCLLEEYNFKDYKEIENPICHGQIIIEFLYHNINKKLYIEEKEEKEYILIKSHLPLYIKGWLEEKNITKTPNDFKIKNSIENKVLLEKIKETIKKHNINI